MHLERAWAQRGLISLVDWGCTEGQLSTECSIPREQLQAENALELHACLTCVGCKGRKQLLN